MRKTWLCRAPWIVLIVLLIGCGETDPRVVQVAMESTRRQAEQNRQMGELQQHVAEGTKQLVDADAQARQQLAELQRELRTDQAEVSRQRDALESERKAIATERRWDSILGTSAYAGAGILACLQERFGVGRPDDLSIGQASEFIDAIKPQPSSAGGRQ